MGMEPTAPSEGGPEGWPWVPGTSPGEARDGWKPTEVEKAPWVPGEAFTVVSAHAGAGPWGLFLQPCGDAEAAVGDVAGLWELRAERAGRRCRLRRTPGSGWWENVPVCSRGRGPPL